MGRFYKTASANPMAYMHRINAPLMERALQFNDEAITDEYAQSQETGAIANAFNRLTDDEARANAISKEYNDRVDQLTKSIAADPANWRNHAEPLRKLKQDLAENFRSGEISKIQSNYSTYKTWKDTQNKMIEQWNKYAGKKGGIDPITAQAYERAYLNKWREGGSGTNFKNGQYNTLHMEDVMANMDLKKEIADGFEKVKADLNAVESNTQKGMYIIKKGNSTETVPKSRLLELAMANIENPTLQTYMRSRQSVGLLNNIYDKDGNMINPVSGFGLDPEVIARGNKIIEDTRKADPKKADQLKAELDAYVASQSDNIRYNPNSGLASIVEGAINSTSWTRNKQTEDVKADPVALPVWMQGRREAQQNATRAQAEAHFQQGRTDKIDAATKAFERSKELIELRGKMAKEVRATGKPTATTKKALENLHAAVYINEVDHPDHDFFSDFAKGDSESKNRLQTASETAKAKVVSSIDNKNNKELANGYLSWLMGKPATDELAEAYYNQQKQAFPNKFSEFPGSTGYGSKLSDRVGGNVDKIRPTLTKLKEVGQTYNKEANSWYADQNKRTDKVDVNPLTPEAQDEIAHAINSSKGGYFVIDENGNKVKSIPELEKVVGSTGGSSQSKLGFRAIAKGGKEMWVFPDDSDNNVYSLNRSNILNGLLDKNSVYATALKVEDINNINTQLRKGKAISARMVYDDKGKETLEPSGMSNVISIGNDKFPAILHDDGSSKLTVKDPDGSVIGEFPSTGDFVQFYYRWQATQQEAAKAKK